MEDKLDLILLKIKTLERKIDEITKTVEAHRLEHGFEKMQDGGINRNFGGTPQGMPGGGGMPGMGGMSGNKPMKKQKNNKKKKGFADL